MSRVIAALAVSVDGFITGRDPAAGRGLGDGGELFDWYTSGDVPSAVFDGFHLSAPSARVFDAIAGSVGVIVAGRRTYDDSRWDQGGAPHPTAPLVVVTHGPLTAADERQTIVTTGIEDAIATARSLAGPGDVSLMGGGVVTSALRAGLVDELVLHQVPILLGAGRRFFQGLPDHVRLEIVEVVPAPGVTHLRYGVIRADPAT
jgi:dihydrofolate reductase